jgi:predicted amidophosphoribosyltransferase
MGLLRAGFDQLVPPLCAACGGSCRSKAIVCGRCERLLAAAEPLRGAGPPGVDRAWSSAPHDGIARDLVASLKFRRLLPVAGLMAERIHRLAPAWIVSGEIVPVPTALLRSLVRGFDPAGEIAPALAERTGNPVRANCLVRHGVLSRQVGRPRARRLGSPPSIHAAGAVPRNVLLVEDVLTTGATLSACARALRGRGATRIVAVSFSRRL